MPKPGASMRLVRDRVAGAAFGREQVHGQLLETGAGIGGLEQTAIDRDGVHGGTRRDRYDEYGRPHHTTSSGRSPARSVWLMPSAWATAARSVTRPRNSGGRCVIHAKLKIFAVPFERNRRRSDTQLEHEIAPASRDHAFEDQRERAAYRRMPGHRQFFGWREDPHPNIAVTLGGKMKVIPERHLGRDPLHQRGRNVARLGKHGELIAFQFPVSEDVEVKISESHAGHSATRERVAQRASNEWTDLVAA